MRNDFDIDNHGRGYKEIIIKVFISLAEVAFVVFAAYAITHYGLEKLVVSGEYMSPTLIDGDNILINKIIYQIFPIKRNDVVVIQKNGSEHDYYTIGRVIGLPGEVVKINEGCVYINGEELSEKFDFPVMENGGLALEDITLGHDEYFLLCDNRNEGEDSRNAGIGNIVKSDIVGKAWLRTNSLAVISSIDKFEEE